MFKNRVSLFVLGTLAVGVAFQMMDFVVTQFLLSADFKSLAHVWRPNMQEVLWIMPVVALIHAMAFTLFYSSWNRGEGIRGGLFYGAMIGLMVTTISVGTQYVIYPITFMLAAKLVTFTMVEFLIAGMVVSLVYRNAPIRAIGTPGKNSRQSAQAV